MTTALVCFEPRPRNKSTPKLRDIKCLSEIITEIEDEVDGEIAGLVTTAGPVVLNTTTMPNAYKDELSQLKDQMAQKALALDDLLSELKSLQNVTATLGSAQKTLETEMAALHLKSLSVDHALSEMNTTDTKMLTNITGLTGKMSKVESSVSGVETMSKKLAKSVSVMNTSLRAQNASLQHHNNVNQVWKSNFRVINSTFRHIRKHVAFPLPAFSYGTK